MEFPFITALSGLLCPGVVVPDWVSQIERFSFLLQDIVINIWFS